MKEEYTEQPVCDSVIEEIECKIINFVKECDAGALIEIHNLIFPNEEIYIEKNHITERV